MGKAIVRHRCPAHGRLQRTPAAAVDITMNNPCRTLYLVVHGIGDPSSGETVREFARGLTCLGDSAASVEEVHWVPEPDPAGADDRTVRAFAVHLLRGDDRRGDLLAEVHWADLSRFPISLLGLAEGFFGVSFGLRYIAYQVVHGLDAPGAGLLRCLGRWSTALLVGPIAALSLLLLFLLLGAAVADWVEVGSFASSPHGDYAGAIACLVAVGVGVALASFLGRNQVLRMVGLSLTGSAGVVLGLALATRAFDPTRRVWGIPRLALLRDELERAGLPHGGIILHAAFCDMMVGLCLLGILLALALSSLVLAWLVLACPRVHARNSALVATLLPFLMVYGWGLVIPMAWAAIGRVLPGGAGFHTTLDVLLSLGTALLPCLLLILAAVGVTTLIVFSLWWRRRVRLGRAPDIRQVADDGARLIVAPWLLGVIALGYAFFVTISLSGYIIPGLSGLEPFGWSGRLRERIDPFMGPILAFSAAALPLLLSQFVPYLRSGLDLIYDVINHFYFRFDAIPDARALARPDNPNFPVRRAIQHRLAASIAHLAEQFTGPDRPPCRLVVLSHSQGTMVAIDVLNDPRLDVAIGRFTSLRLVTMGSPFSHIYQHYFRHHYPELRHGHWETLSRRLGPRADGPAPWLNLYRVDDYVGRSIDESRTGLVENCPIRPRGHLGYWIDREVLGILSDHRIL